MSEIEKEQTVQEEISARLYEALTKAKDSTGVLVLVADKDGSIWTYSAGDLVIQLGLVQAASQKGREFWEDTKAVDDE